MFFKLLSISVLSVLCVAEIDLNQCSGDACDEPSDNLWIKKDTSECNQKYFSADSFVCVCSEYHCDYPGMIDPPSDPSTYVTVTSSRDTARFQVEDGIMQPRPSIDKLTAGTVRVTVNPRITYQSMLGYGGSFTDAAGMNLMSLSPAMQESAIKSYFSKEGLAYTLGRVPIGGSDFSTTPYAYNEVEDDTELENFSLTNEDYQYKIPFIRKAMKLTEDTLKLVASPWAPPAWMKTNGMLNGTGSLFPNLYQTYSQYLIKFLEHYKENNINIFAMTPQNEPLAGTLEDWPFNNCVWLAEDMRNLIAEYLGPALLKSGYEDIKLIVNDQVRAFTLDYVNTILRDQRAYQYVDGISMHWYLDSASNVDVLDNLTVTFPDLFTLYTEACTGFDSPKNERVLIGDWKRAERYIESMIETANHGVTGWIDWNLILDLQGGPNWSGNYVDAPILVDKEFNVFYKQPMFYALGHFSKFVTAGSKAVYHSLSENSSINIATFVNTDATGVLILLNKNEDAVPVTVDFGSYNDRVIQLSLPAKSFKTVLYKIS